MKWRINPNAKHKNLDCGVRQRCEGSRVFGKEVDNIYETWTDTYLNDIKNARYRVTISPEVAEHIVINKETLQRNNSLKKLGDVIARFQ